MRWDYREIGKREGTCSGSACLPENVSYDCISYAYDLCTHAGSASGLEPVLYAMTNCFGLSGIYSRYQLSLWTELLRGRGNTLYIRVCDEKTQGCGEPSPSHKTRHVSLLRSLIFEPQYSVSPGHLIVILYTYVLTRICSSALDHLFLVNCLPGVLALVVTLISQAFFIF